MIKKEACTLLVVLTLSLSLIPGCLGETKLDVDKRQYVEEELTTMFDLMFYVCEMDPTTWTGIESYYAGDFSNTEKLEEYLTQAYEGYKKVKEYFENFFYGMFSLEVEDEICHLRSYLYLAAEHNKIAIDLLKKDVDQKTNYSMSVISDMGFNFNNFYYRYFFDEYDNIAEKYGLPKKGE